MHRLKFCQNVSNLLLFENRTLGKCVQTYLISQNRSSVSNYNSGENRSDENITSRFQKNNWRKLPKKYDEFDEKTFLLRLKKDPDTFGKPSDPETYDQGDILEEKHFTEQVDPSRKLSTKQYADMIKDLIGKRKIKEAVDVLEERMLKNDKVKPENYIFNLVIGALGRVGYTKKAFSLFNKMKQRGLKVHISTYTSLFNACANSPFPDADGLVRAQKLRELMIEKGAQPNESVYNSMIKAFGRCGDLNTAFSIADEMHRNKLIIKEDTMNFLLQACISDKESGFRHALLVWRKMVDKNIQPDIFSYNLLLRCTRDCGLGDLEVTRDVIGKIVGEDAALLVGSHHNAFGDHKTLLLGSNVVENCNKLTSKSVDFNKILVGHINLENNETKKESSFETNQVVHEYDNIDSNNLEVSNVPKGLTNFQDPRPNLLARKPHLGNVMALSEVKKSEDRLLLLGGYMGFLKSMLENNCKPNIKTFTQLLECMPNSTPLEKDLILKIKECELVADIDFFNILMKKRSMRFDYEGAREVLKVMKKMRYKPDVITYGVLAMGCTTKEKALELINEMKQNSYSLNPEIMGTLVSQACHQGNFDYISEIMDICLKDNIHINKRFTEHLDRFKKVYRAQMNHRKLTRNQEKKFVTWKAKYREFMEKIRTDETENIHPWQQYQTEAKGEEFKWKDKSRFKPRHISKFRVKTSKKIRY